MMAKRLSELYQIESPLNKSMSMMGAAGQTAGNFDRKQPVPPKTVGGGMMNAMGAAGTMGALQATGAFAAAPAGIATVEGATAAGLATGGEAALAGAMGEGGGMMAALGGPWGLAGAAVLGAMAYYLS